MKRVSRAGAIALLIGIVVGPIAALSGSQALAATLDPAPKQDWLAAAGRSVAAVTTPAKTQTPADGSIAELGAAKGAEPSTEPTVTATVPARGAQARDDSAGAPLPVDPIGGIFGADSFWRTSIASAPVASDSDALAQGLEQEVTSLYNGVAALNVYSYSTNFYTVPADQPTSSGTWDNCQDKDYTPDGLTGPGGILTDVPIPSYATPDEGTDGEVTIYSPSLDQLWEFWQPKKTATGWSACWGGHMTNVSTSPGYFTGGWGATATGLPVAGGMITMHDVKAGYIDHAMSLIVPNTAIWTDYSWPAQRSDGGSTAADAIPEGTRFKLPASVDIAALNLSPLATLIAQAAQTYGFVVIDTGGQSPCRPSPASPSKRRRGCRTCGPNTWGQHPPTRSWPTSPGRSCRPSRRTTASS